MKQNWKDIKYDTSNIREWVKEYKENPYCLQNNCKREGESWSDYYSRQAKKEQNKNTESNIIKN